MYFRGFGCFCVLFGGLSFVTMGLGTDCLCFWVILRFRGFGVCVGCLGGFWRRVCLAVIT